jgi:hypothetical protein
MCIESEETDTTRYDELGVSNKEMITNNHYQELVTKDQCQIINYENGITKKRLLNSGYQKPLRNNHYP